MFTWTALLAAPTDSIPVRHAPDDAHSFSAWRAYAEAAGGLLLFGDEASFAQWGALGYTWARVGQQPVVKTTGKRKAYTVFGLIELVSGRLFYQGIEGRFNGQSYIAFLTTVLEQTTEPLFLVQDGAPYHRAAPVTAFFDQHRDRLHVIRLPSYSPDYNPIEFLWRATKRSATHNRYFPEFSDLAASAEDALASFARQPHRVKASSDVTSSTWPTPTPLILTWALRLPSAERFLTIYSSASASGSQYAIPIARSIVTAVISSVRAASRRSRRR